MKTVLGLAMLLILSATLIAQPPAAPEVTEHHKTLQRDVGVWDGQMKMWMVPDQEPQVMPLVETNTMLAGDLWLLSEFDCGPFQGRAQIGYDTNQEKFVGTWIDSMSTYQSIMTGTMNDAGELVMFSTSYDPATNAPFETKSTAKMTGEDTREFIMYKQGEGEEEWEKLFEITYTRRKE